MTPAEIRETQARLYYAEDALERGLIDELGDRTAAEEYLSTHVSTEDLVIDRPGDDDSSPFPGVRAGMHALGHGVTAAVLERRSRQ